MHAHDVWLRILTRTQGLYLYVKKNTIYLLIELNVLILTDFSVIGYFSVR
jgi:hypothetical protein